MNFHTVEFENDYVLGFIICEIFTVIALQDGVGWGIFTVIPGCPRRANGDCQHLETRPELQDWLRSELFTEKNYRTGPFSKELGNNSNSTVKCVFHIRKDPEGKNAKGKNF